MFRTLGLRRRLWASGGLGVAILVLLILPPILPSYVVILLTQSLIYGIVAMSLDVLIGYTGLGALGHAAYFAIGAYTTAILATRYHAGFGVSFPASIGMAAGSSAVIGLMALRAVGVQFILITLAIALCIWGLIYRWVSLTGADNGISSIPRPDLGFPLDLHNHLHFHYFILVAFIICLVLIFLLTRSPFGRTLVAIRDSESRMRVLGFDVWLHKYFAYIIAGAFAGLGGALYAHFSKFVGPDDASLEQCMEFILMVSLGGRGTLIGPNIGSFVITFLKNLVSVYTGRWLLIVAAIYVLTAKYAPEGIMGWLKGFQRRGEGK
jgi:branched-chain amino acid transport system permease protein